MPLALAWPSVTEKSRPVSAWLSREMATNSSFACSTRQSWQWSQRLFQSPCPLGSAAITKPRVPSGTHRRAALEEQRRKTAHIPRLANRFDERRFEEPDIVSAGLRQMTDRLFAALGAAEVRYREPLTRLFVGGLPDQDPSATLTAFPDGSGRILVSDGVHGLVHLLATLATTWYFGFGGKRWRGWSANRKRAAAMMREDEVHPQTRVLLAALRWNLIHRRAWGNSATLAVEPRGEPAEGFAEVCSQLALAFMLAHETGHHVLGHSVEQIGSWDAENQADAFALRATYEYLKVAEAGPVWFLTLTGARLAIMAAHLVEQALFVTPPVTHPSAEKRWSNLTDSVSEKKALGEAVVVTAGLGQAVGLAANLRFSMPPEWWTAAYADPSVHCDVHEPDYYENMSLFDRLSFGDPEHPARMLKVFADRGELDTLSAALLAKREGLAPALAQLGIPDDVATASAQPGAVLSYHRLVELVHGAPAVASVESSTTRRLAAVAIATLLGGVHKGVLSGHE